MTAIAVIGQACRFPGAAGPEAYWANLLAERDCVQRSDRGALVALVPPERLEHPDFIAASGLLDDVYAFDAARYRMAPREALVTDPQHRLFLQAAREALEHAGIRAAEAGPIAVFAGVGRNRYEEMVRATLPDPDVEDITLEIGNGPDYFATKVSYRLGLTGPSLALQSACSTGLLAVHQAAMALAGFECDVALAGAATVRLPLEYGYVFRHGGIASPSGYCRPFSAAADGSVPGDGVGCVVLRRLDDALADGDCVLAVLRGSAANNDGVKDGFASVSVRAQTEAIESALGFAELDPAEIGYVEAHGTGTALGDETEWTALARVYGGAVTVGSVKSNLGHLREASGIAGLIKAIGVVREGVIPASLHDGRPADYVRAAHDGPRLAEHTGPWDGGCRPRRAGVSSFGLGGTNVHVIVEQPPPAQPEPESARIEVLTVSAHTAAALRTSAERLAVALAGGGSGLAGAAATLQDRRGAERYRWTVAAADLEQARRELGAPPENVGEPATDDLRIGFVYPGIGDHYAGMAGGLLDCLPQFRTHLYDALKQAADLAGRDFRRVLYPDGEVSAAVVNLRSVLKPEASGKSALSDPVNAHVVSFCVQLALTRALAAVGVAPDAVLGHSLGELAAATVAGVFDAGDAIRVVVHRARLIRDAPPGGMLAVALPAADTADLCGDGVWLATVNTPNSCVLGGDPDALAQTVESLRRRGAYSQPMSVAHPFHTPLLTGAAEQLAELLGSLPMRSPGTAVVTGLTGDWIDSDMARPAFWTSQLTSTAHFGPAVLRLAERCRVLVEIGPGQLRAVAAQSGGRAQEWALATVRRRYEPDGDELFLARTLGRLWERGAPIDWTALRGGFSRACVPLPPVASDDAVLRVDTATLHRPAMRTRAVAVTTDREADGRTASSTIGSGGFAGDMERTLAEAWRSVLGVAEVRPGDGFFALGGDSLMGMRMTELLAADLGVAPPTSVVFLSAELAEMAAHIQQWLDEQEGIR